MSFFIPIAKCAFFKGKQLKVEAKPDIAIIAVRSGIACRLWKKIAYSGKVC